MSFKGLRLTNTKGFILIQAMCLCPMARMFHVFEHEYSAFAVAVTNGGR